MLTSVISRLSIKLALASAPGAGVQKQRVDSNSCSEITSVMKGYKTPSW